MEEDEKEKVRRETDAYLAKIRDTIRKSRTLVESAELRIAETDRLLESEGLTREEVSGYTFTEEHLRAVNAELRRRGLPEIDPEDGDGNDPYTEQARRDLPAVSHALRERETPTPEASDSDGTVENRRRKFGVMMQQFRM